MMIIIWFMLNDQVDLNENEMGWASNVSTDYSHPWYGKCGPSHRLERISSFDWNHFVKKWIYKNIKCKKRMEKKNRNFLNWIWTVCIIWIWTLVDNWSLSKWLYYEFGKKNILHFKLLFYLQRPDFISSKSVVLLSSWLLDKVF